jgi:bifunctional DNA-binding transcriptional regulator/antitoxin component of YhaV-PrlF toxin-antitoxin module
MEEIRLKLDSKGRICLPPEIREKIGNVATLKKTPDGYIITPGKNTDFLEEFQKTISSEPKRTGKPKLASPQQMKSIWRTQT